MSHAAPFVPPDIEALRPFFPNYEIEGLIACGGMGAVYRARQTALERDVAIKILPLEFSSDKDFRDSFAAEAKAMAKLNHTNLIGVYDFGEANGMLFIIMEFVPGQSLYQVADGKPVEVQEVAELMTQICAGLAHAHQHGILHRDIKPANILLDLQSHPKIGDFGLARPIGLAARDDEIIFGTPHYTAPEVVERPKEVDARADIFSLGVLLHELLTGKLPASDKRPPSAISGCPVSFDAIVQRATNPNPAMRYSDVATMGRELASLASALRRPGGPTVSKAPAPTHMTGATGRRPHAAQVAHSPQIARRKSTARATSSGRSSGGGGGFWMLLALCVLAGIVYLFMNTGAKDKTKAETAGNVDAPAAPRPKYPTQPLDRNTSTPVARPPVVDDGADAGNTASNNSTHTGTSSATGNQNAWSSNTLDTPDTTDSKVPDKKTATGESFDVQAFLTRARDIMRQKSQPAITARDTALKKNLEDFERKLSRRARDIDDRDQRKDAQDMIELRVSQWQTAGHRLPTANNVGLYNVPGVRAIYDLCLMDEQKIDAEFEKKLTELGALYVKGIELQIDRLDKRSEDSAISELKDEVTATRENIRHFHAFIEDLPPQQRAAAGGLTRPIN